jgi:E3 ubiquitin-protein ligase HUWE1
MGDCGIETEVVRRTVPLKLMLRSIHRLMTTGGNAEGLRNLIDSQLPKSLLRALQNANRLGTPVLAITINITATFIHNEPTSLSIIQEMKLPEAIYDALENNNNPSYEVGRIIYCLPRTQR